ncbi:MAG: MopE-related protein, partial [Myxococcota bacterium]
DGYDDVVYCAMQFDGGRTFALFGSPTGYGSPYSEWPWEVPTPTGYADLFGAAVSRAGDVNGDGYGDVAVGAPWVNVGGFASGGAVYVFHGAASGLPTTASVTLEGPASNEALCGSAIAPLGDVEGDGYDDILVGCPGYESSAAQTDEGMVRYYHGTVVGLSTSATTTEGNEANAKLGFAVAGVGDVNGDGRPDGAAGAYQGDYGETDEGTVSVYAGGATGLATTATWVLDADQDGAQFGYAVAGAGDVDGDGYDDVLVGAPEAFDGQVDEGVAYLHEGSATGPSATAAWRVGTDQTSGKGADAVAGVGDVNGDGFADVVVGSSQYDGTWTDGGRAALYLGSAAGLSTTAAWTIEGGEASARLGIAVAGGGDWDGDGFGDVLVGATGVTNPFGNGDVHLFRGGASGLATTASQTWEGDQFGAKFGQYVAFGGDVDGDGDDEILFGVPYQDEEVSAGGVARAVFGEAVDADGDGVAGGDCDDSDPDAFPGAEETCNGVDDDCDGVVDDTGDTWFADADEDGFGDAATARVACAAPDGYVADATDCDDTRAAAHPGADETCDDRDDDCDGDVDEDAVDAPTWRADRDGDGYGDPSGGTVACDAPTGTVADGRDCDDTDGRVSPAATERCDGVDEDCDGTADDGATDAATWYADTDGDGFGGASSTRACSAPAGHVATATDCDDTSAGAFPGAVETCDGRDDDCDGATDEAGASGASTWYTDADGDSYGDPGSVRVACSAPAGTVADASDCDDGDGTVSPAGVEACN